jgi:hypothetical protein
LSPDVTTVMIRHIPHECSERQVMREINDAGFKGKYDFFYLPLDLRTRANRGFAFLNFEAPAVAQEFYTAFHGTELCNHVAENGLVVLPAQVQGFDRNAANCLRERRSHGRPVFFKALPPHPQSFGAVLPHQVEPRSKRRAVRLKDRGLPEQPAPKVSLAPQARFCVYCGGSKKTDSSICPKCGHRWLA